MSGSVSERSKYQGGLVFAPTSDLAKACQYYLQRPLERRIIANRGRELYELQEEAQLLRDPVEQLLQQA